MENIYITSAGEMWDQIAFKLYGNVSYTEFLMSNNQVKTLLATVIFDAGTILSTPPLPAITSINPGTPPWRTM